jgi:hypothetical protein
MEDYNEIIRKQLIALQKEVAESNKIKQELIVQNEWLKKNVADLQSQYYELVKHIDEMKKEEK